MDKPLSTVGGTQYMLSKVPEITIWFWVTKILTTGMGEVFSDYLCKNINPIIAVMLGLTGFVAALVLQIKLQRYVTWIYWLTVVMVSIFGTMAADVLHVGFGIPYIVSTTIYVIALAAILTVWYVSEKTLSVHSIFTRRRELFYWATVLITFALGTAAGDLTATTLHFGYFTSGIMFMGLILIPALAYRFFAVNEIFSFWFAYIMTRPLGASFADWVSVSHSRGGLGVGTGQVSLVLAVIIVGLVAYLSTAKNNNVAN
jgi:uncharacterized membrane-anchored protein